MNPYRMLSTILLMSTVFLMTGAIILRLENLVPPILTLGTIATIVVILVTAHFTWRNSFGWSAIGVVLAIVSIVFNSTEPQHLQAMKQAFSSTTFLILIIAEIMAFYVLPAIYLTIYGMSYSKLKKM